MSSPFPVPDALAHVAPPVPGVRLGEPLGQGGFATVYAGEQVSLRRPVAVKIDSRPLHDERNRRRFMREMAAASRISGHPNAVSLIDSGVLPDGRPYLVMERCDGGSLAQVLERCELSAAQAVSIVTAVSAALGAAHEAGVLHRGLCLRIRCKTLRQGLPAPDTRRDSRRRRLRHRARDLEPDSLGILSGPDGHAGLGVTRLRHRHSGGQGGRH
ncbi:protein kinase domain-containing protein [Actinomyces naeslundii]|uniref:protein kinase domain-containing protein n=1 Tax=Actinomyces naeslundii TaxID=1655 RepID=UPI0021162244|nr:protein kinase [Actinomyces naeslundii]